MKLPPQVYSSDTYVEELFAACQKAAIQLTIRTGTVVQAVVKPVGQEYDPYVGSAMMTSDEEHEVVFLTMGKTYETLKEVRRALKLKAFL